LEGVVSALETHFACCQPMQLLVQTQGEVMPGFWRQRR
jgi:hypothetical protein